MQQHTDRSMSCTLRLLRDFQDAIGEATSALARRLNLSATDAAAIEHISLSEQPVGPGELAARLAITRSSATEVVDRLVNSGMIERVRDESDRRRFRLVPTESAHDQVREGLGSLIEAITTSANEYSSEEHRVIQKFIASVTSAYYDYASTAGSRTHKLSESR